MLLQTQVLKFVIFAMAALSYNGLAFSQVRPTREEATERIRATFGPPPGFKMYSEKGLIWINPVRQMLAMDGYVTLRQGQLEMFACAVGTKEHESIVAVFGQASWVHAGLLAIGAKSGTPVQFDPFQPATGSTINVYVLWYDEKGEKRTRAAQDWIVDLETKQTMRLDWVFAGSAFVKSEFDGQEQYLADYGDFITVANFPSATLDLAVRSNASNSMLQFGPNTEEMPPLYTPVRLILEVSDRAPRQ